ncbi:transposase [Bacteroides graminisolvens]|uniref:transposase n=2 Tax=Bacteroides TaxID=816 RepID=UPI0029C6634F|nr:transposase [Bacteroides graminisolvens]
MMDSTTISLFDNILKGVGRHPKSGRKKGGMKVHTVMKYHVGLPMVVQLTSAAKQDHYLLKEVYLPKDSTLAMDRGYIDIAQFQGLTEKGVCYVTKMKRNLKYEVLESITYVNPQGLVTHIDQKVSFTRNELTHEARRVAIFDNKKKAVVLLTNNFEFSVEDISEIYRLKWGHREPVQAAQAKLSAAFLLWRQRQCHTNPNVGGTDCQPALHCAVKNHQAALRFLATRDYGAPDTHVLHRFHSLYGKSRQDLGGYGD